MDWHAYLAGLGVTLALGVLGWLVSTARRNVTLVDSLWPLFFVAVAAVVAALTAEPGPRTTLVVVLVGLWALRLALHLTWRNWGQPEDHRYRALRARFSPGFVWKSLVVVFGLQATLAWLIAWPLAVAIASPGPLGLLDALAVGVVLTGILFEALADWQLARFRAEPANRGRVMDTGLWRYSRHPNYFGEAWVWWGLWLLALAGGGWWTVVAPVLMTYLLLRVSGVALLERDIGERRPAYRDYVARTSAFVPWPPRCRAGRTPEDALA
jgi:steroid 5-alpha reductase family enzyme